MIGDDLANTTQTTDDMTYNSTSDTNKIQAHGAFNVTETPQDGWKVTDASCTVFYMNGTEKETYTSDDVGNETATGLVEIPEGAVDPMDFVVCDYVNSAAANITINKDSGMY